MRTREQSCSYCVVRSYHVSCTLCLAELVVLAPSRGCVAPEWPRHSCSTAYLQCTHVVRRAPGLWLTATPRVRQRQDPRTEARGSCNALAGGEVRGVRSGDSRATRVTGTTRATAATAATLAGHSARTARSSFIRAAEHRCDAKNQHADESLGTWRY
jgi:hypothetical protein